MMPLSSSRDSWGSKCFNLEGTSEGHIMTSTAISEAKKFYIPLKDFYSRLEFMYGWNYFANSQDVAFLKQYIDLYIFRALY